MDAASGAHVRPGAEHGVGHFGALLEARLLAKHGPLPDPRRLGMRAARTHVPQMAVARVLRAARQGVCRRVRVGPAGKHVAVQRVVPGGVAGPQHVAGAERRGADHAARRGRPRFARARRRGARGRRHVHKDLGLEQVRGEDPLHKVAAQHLVVKVLGEQRRHVDAADIHAAVDQVVAHINLCALPARALHRLLEHLERQLE